MTTGKHCLIDAHGCRVAGALSCTCHCERHQRMVKTLVDEMRGGDAKSVESEW